MQLLPIWDMQQAGCDTTDEGCDANNDDEASKTNSSEAKLIDCGDILPRYHDISPLGCGAKAIIFSAIDQNCQKRIAVKKVTLKSSNIAADMKQLFREIRVLKQLDHDNVVKIYHTLISTKRKNSSGSPLNVSAGRNNHFPVPSFSPIDAVYIGMELMDTDLQSIIAQQKLTPAYTRLFLYQLLRGVKYIHSANVIHRDINPTNILINVDTLMLKIGDFGVCRIFDDDYDHQGKLSMAAASTHYQAPELILHPRHYSKAVDVWAVGCVFAAMIGGKALFNGDSAIDQINLILGSVAVTSLSWTSVAGGGCSDRKCCPHASLYGTRDNGGHPDLPLRDALSKASLMAINLLQQLLTFDPCDRVTASDALMHRYLSPYPQSSDEPTCYQPFHVEDELESDVTLANCQQYLHSEVGKFASFDYNFVENSTEDGLSSRRSSKASLSQFNDSSKNLTSLATTVSHSSTQSTIISESEARTIACDFDYGVQITDGSVKRERVLDFQPIQSSTDCFDPYKWDHHDDEEKVSDVKPESGIMEDGRPDSHSDHGYHSSYCSSNVSRNHPHSMWSLSSPDVSVDMGGSHRASAPEMGELTALANMEGDGHLSDTRPSPTLEDKDARRRHKDEAPRHYHHSYHHHHHHHHHHHKHHRHGGRHSNSTPQPASNEPDVSAPTNGRRHCVVTDVVLEEESNGGESKEEVASDAQESPALINQFDSIKEKAPSERFAESQPAQLKLFPRPPDGAHIQLNAGSGVWRSRTRSDGSQCRRPGLVPFNQNLLEQLGVPGEAESPVFPSTRPTSLVYSHLGEAQQSGSLSSLYRPLVSRKCATRENKPAVYPFKQVECPF